MKRSIIEEYNIDDLISRQLFIGGVAEGIVRKSGDLLICGRIPCFDEDNIYRKFDFIISKLVESSRYGRSIVFTSNSIKQKWMVEVDNYDLGIKKIIYFIEEFSENFDINISDFEGCFDICVDALDRMMIVRSTPDVYAKIINDFGGCDEYLKFISPSLRAASFSEPIWRNQNSPYFSSIRL